MLMGEVMKTASFSLAEAKFSMSGDFTQVVIQSVSKAQIKIRTKRDNVAGKYITKHLPTHGSTVNLFRCYSAFISIVQ
jgi:vacuolar-type H+-ATPase subunit D/Vma8